MNQPQVVIQPRRSLAVLAAISLIVAALSYLVILAIAAVCVYGPYLLLANDSGFHVQLLLLLVGGVAIAGVLLWSVVPRFEKAEAPGLLLRKESQPRMFAEIAAISSALDEPMPSEIYLIGDANAFVANRGGILGFGGRRILAIGLPLFYAMNLAEWRALLAHEFAHYYSGDTKLGPLLYRTQKAMLRVFENLSSVRGLTRVGVIQMLYLMVFYLLKGTFLLFLRVINFASRKKEFRADELAGLVAGTEATSSCLMKIHAASKVWREYWKGELQPFLESGNLPRIGDGFVRFLAAPNVSRFLDAAMAKEIAEGKTSPYDTHPPLAERLSAMAKMPAIRREGGESLAADILREPEELEREFIEFMNPKLPKGKIRMLSWDVLGETLTIPAWKMRVSKYCRFFEGITATSLPDLFPRLPEIAAAIENTPGRLWSSQQKAEQASQLLGVAVCLVMLENGWKLNSQPGNFHLSRGKEIAHVFAEIRSLQQGKMTLENWREKCVAWGIGDVALARDGVKFEASQS